VVAFAWGSAYGGCDAYDALAGAPLFSVLEAGGLLA
jgi:hypothetical protein